MIRTAAKGNPCVMAVKGKQLVEQASQRLFHEGVPHGVRQANHWNNRYNEKIQICSIDTLLSRQDFPPAKLLVIDEAHIFVSDQCVEFAAHYPDAFMLSVTATPYPRKSLKHIAETVVHPITMQGLIDQGYLVTPRYYAPSTPDLKGVHSRNGDFMAEELQERMSILTGDLPTHWRKFGEDRPTLCFAVNIKHSMSIVEQFNRNGIPAEHIEGGHSFEERLDAIERLRTGKIKILSNVGVLCTGVDIPFASAILMARPTKSYPLYIQQAGRGTRISPDTNKRDFLILDHAGNVLRHGFIQDEPEVELEGIKVDLHGEIPHMCLECYVIFTGNECPACGWSAPVAPITDRKEIEIEAGILRELKNLPKAAEISIFIRRSKELAKRRGYKKGWVFHRVKEMYGEEIAALAFPKRQSPWWF